MNYFKITGFENGEPIEPYVVATHSSYPIINNSRNYDSARYYEPISKKEYEELIKKEQQQVMVLKVKENKNSRFYEKGRARLFNKKEMEELKEMISACVSCGCEIKVELKSVVL